MGQISYELARELKDNGYPQKEWNYYVIYDGEKYGRGMVDHLKDPNHEKVHMPNISEKEARSWLKLNKHE